MESTAIGTTRKEKTVEVFVFIFLLLCPFLWLWAKLSYNPKTGSYRYSPPVAAPVPPKPAPKPVPYNRHMEEVARLHQWTVEFQELARRTCTHRYLPEDSLQQGWYICLDCGYEKPWEWQAGCSCIWLEDRKFTDAYGTKIVTHRSGNCRFHGMPRIIRFNAKAEGARFARDNKTD